MPTSSFAKKFKVRKDKQQEFVNVMLTETSPTLPKGFQSMLAFPSRDKELKAKLHKALSN